MSRSRIRPAMIVLAALVMVPPHLGCQTSVETSNASNFYTLARDYQDERRVLRVAPSPGQVAACMQAALPINGSAGWKEYVLDASLHAGLVEQMRDETRAPSYEADTQFAEKNELLVCEPRPGTDDFCYLSEVVVSGAGSLWRFVLPPDGDPSLTEASLDLIDTFLLAHDACWNGEGVATNGATSIR
ncbi:MAG: hypothetical protein JRF54_00865 [Deltaproteobacteria bacterium]|nr:hypothetical protein [Deltaproteobacteria bacterium]MBW2402879.1 hypothetical protein [Deltaproteobacteria bacterium]MBW2546613.1 hypothetical protein [Deltaproteobacteria bacterium]MBW2718458.1 hypothetical protein [Deltaproteobacteria bacterium]